MAYGWGQVTPNSAGGYVQVHPDPAAGWSRAHPPVRVAGFTQIRPRVTRQQLIHALIGGHPRPVYAPVTRRPPASFAPATAPDMGGADALLAQIIAANQPQALPNVQGVPAGGDFSGIDQTILAALASAAARHQQPRYV